MERHLFVGFGTFVPTPVALLLRSVAYCFGNPSVARIPEAGAEPSLTLVSAWAQSLRPLRDLSSRRTQSLLASLRGLCSGLGASATLHLLACFGDFGEFSKNFAVSRPPTRFVSRDPQVFALSPSRARKPALRLSSSRRFGASSLHVFTFPERILILLAATLNIRKEYVGGNVPPFRLRGLLRELRALRCPSHFGEAERSSASPKQVSPSPSGSERLHSFFARRFAPRYAKHFLGAVPIRHRPEARKLRSLVFAREFLQTQTTKVNRDQFVIYKKQAKT